MRRSIRALARIAIVGLAMSLPVALARPASAHQHRHVNGFDTTVGWSEEPAFSGVKNAVTFRIEDEDGNPVEDATLQVVVFFGPEASGQGTGSMDLEPAFGNPGAYEADLIPTEPGTYTFQISGSIGDVEIDEVYTSGDEGENEASEGTFDDVRDPSPAQFPSKHPTTGDLAARLDRIDTRLSAATGTDTMTVLALILAGIGLLVAGIAVARKGPAGS